MNTLVEIEAEVDRLAYKIGACGSVLPTYGYSEDLARPHIEVDSRGYHYVIIERGREEKRLTTQSIDELLYIIFDDVSFSLATEYEFAHRVPGKDFRRLLFHYQVELMTILSKQWAERLINYHQQILQRYPFEDNRKIR